MDIEIGKINLPCKRSGKSLRVSVDENDLDFLEKVIDLIHQYGVSSQEDHDHDLSKREKEILRGY
jgi:hypothetical protein